VANAGGVQLCGEAVKEGLDNSRWCVKLLQICVQRLEELFLKMTGSWVLAAENVLKSF
jgi:hypothetical protein